MCVYVCACSRYDGTVRNSSGDVMQFVYGEDGMDGSRVESQVIFVDRRNNSWCVFLVSHIRRRLRRFQVARHCYVVVGRTRE